MHCVCGEWGEGYKLEVGVCCVNVKCLDSLKIISLFGHWFLDALGWSRKLPISCSVMLVIKYCFMSEEGT